MEKKKLLLVAVSVGVFLTIVISASILIFSPRSGGTAVSASKPIPVGTAGGSGGSVRVDAPLRTQPATVDAAEMVRNADSIQGLQPPPASPEPIQEPNFYIGSDTIQPEAAPAEKTRESPDTLVISVPKPAAAAVRRTPGASTAAAPKPAPAPANRPAPAQTKPAAAKPAPAAPKPAPAAAQKPAAGTKAASASPAAKPAPAARPVAAAKPAPAKPAAAPKVQQDYWVQTGAFNAKIRAEGAKETLADKGIASIIDGREVNGKTWYRVRVGPYTSETEARYWLALVQSIDGFDGSQVRSEPR